MIGSTRPHTSSLPTPNGSFQRARTAPAIGLKGRTGPSPKRRPTSCRKTAISHPIFWIRATPWAPLIWVGRQRLSWSTTAPAWVASFALIPCHRSGSGSSDRPSPTSTSCLISSVSMKHSPDGAQWMPSAAKTVWKTHKRHKRKGEEKWLNK